MPLPEDLSLAVGAEITATDFSYGSSHTNGHLYGVQAMGNILSGDLQNPDSVPLAEAFDPRTGTTHHGFRFPRNVVQDSRIPVGTIAMLNSNGHMVFMAPDGRTVEFDVRDVMLHVDPARTMSDLMALKAAEFGSSTIRGTMQVYPESHKELMRAFGFTDKTKPVIVLEDDMFFEDRTW